MDVDAIRVGGEWVRHAPQHSELLGRAAEPTDGRWQRGDVVDALYLADQPDTAIAEWYRFLAEHGLPPGEAIPHEHHVWQLDLEERMEQRSTILALRDATAVSVQYGLGMRNQEIWALAFGDVTGRGATVR